MVIIGSGESDTSTMHSRATRRDTRNAPENDDRCDTRYTHTLAISHGLAMRAMDDRTREALTSEARFFAFQTRESGVHVALSFSCGRVIILANPLSHSLAPAAAVACFSSRLARWFVARSYDSIGCVVGCIGDWCRVGDRGRGGG